jgi:two-component system, NarL family, nitrate/nitrite response regulator NarL
MKDTPIRIVILDSHELVRAGIRLLLERHPGLEVVGESGTVADGVEVISNLKPEIILLDMNLDGQRCSEVVSLLISVSEQSRIIAVAWENDPITIQHVIELGVVGVILKNQSPQTLYKAIEKVQAGEVWLERSMIASVLSRFSRNDKSAKTDTDYDNINELSQREIEIIGFIGQGFKNKKIADQMCISETTVRHHLTSIYSKLGVSDRLELLVFAHRHGLVKANHK